MMIYDAEIERLGDEYAHTTDRQARLALAQTIAALEQARAYERVRAAARWISEEVAQTAHGVRDAQGAR